MINGVFAFWQEFKAERATEALRQMLPSYARVLREGGEQHVLSEELTPGDVMLVAEGDRISADARLVEEAELRVNQSTLSRGKSHPVQKSAEAVLRTDLSRSEMRDLCYRYDGIFGRRQGGRVRDRNGYRVRQDCPPDPIGGRGIQPTAARDGANKAVRQRVCGQYRGALLHPVGTGSAGRPGGRLHLRAGHDRGIRTRGLCCRP